MRIQIQLQQFEKKFCIEHGKRQTQDAAELSLPAGNKMLSRSLGCDMRCVALAGSLGNIKSRITSSEILQFQREPQFLRVQRPRS